MTEVPVSVEWVGRRSYDEGQGGCEILPYLVGESQFFVGYIFKTEKNLFADCRDGWLYQTRVTADFQVLREKKAIAINRAVIGFHEEIFASYPERPFSCIADVTGATTPEAVGWHFPNEEIGAWQEATNLWNVTNRANQWLHNPEDNHGFVFKAFHDGFPFLDAACVAALDTIFVEVRFAALPPPAREPIPIADQARLDADIVAVPKPIADPIVAVDPNVRVVPPFDPKIEQIEVIREPTATPFPQPQADLLVTRIQVRGAGVSQGSNCNPGENTIFAMVKNAGVVAAGPFDVQLILDRQRGGNPVRVINGLAPGQETEVRFPPVSLSRGPWDVEVYADYNGDVPESDPNNNGKLEKVQCD